MIKNLALLVIVGLPTLTAAVALTLWLGTPARLAIIVPTFAVPIVSWLCVCSLISVLHPVSVKPLFRRWRRRRRQDGWRTAGWLFAVALPYALYYVADPMGGIEHSRPVERRAQAHLADIRARHQVLGASGHRGRSLAGRRRGGGALGWQAGVAVPMRNRVSMASRHALGFEVR